jgi:hypothetical protein
MPKHRIVVVTGASGAGKTTLVRALDARRLNGLRCYYVDSIGVPSTDEMVAGFGSPAAWQETMTRRWIGRLVENYDGARIAVLDGQVRPSVVRRALIDLGVSNGRIVLVDCEREVRDARLRGERGQAELATDDMTAWAAYLRGQADALELPIIDTTGTSIAAATEALAGYVLSDA